MTVCSDIERTEAMIASLRAKLRAARDDGSKDYYRLCIAGWERWLKKLKAEDVSGHSAHIG